MYWALQISEFNQVATWLENVYSVVVAKMMKLSECVEEN